MSRRRRRGARPVFSDFNNDARIVNITVTQRNFPLQPLHAIATGLDIPDFPQTVADIARIMQGTCIP